MSKEMSIFKQGGAVAGSKNRELSSLAKSLAKSDITTRRIQTNTNGTFKRIINGEQVGNAVRGELNVIIINALPKVSRIYYKEKYDPNGDPTLPNCWSNSGDKPEAAAADPQHSICAECPMNVQGSGENGGRACRFQRRIAVLVEGDPTGDIYQFNVPAKSLFGKGVGNTHPFESYVKYLAANNFSVDRVVTTIAFDAEADTMELLFSPLREISDEEYDLITQAQANPEADMYTKITVAQADKVTKQPAPVKQQIARSDEPDEEVIEEPVKRAAKKSEPTVAKKSIADVINVWGDDDE